MKRIILFGVMIVSSTLAMSQNLNDDIEVVRDMAAAERRAIVADNMMMNEEESKAFWPVYDEYRSEVKKIGTRKIEYLQNFAANYEGMTDEKALEIMNDYFSVELDYAKLRIAYKEKFLKVVGSQLVFRFFQIENKVDALIEIGMAQEVPLIIKK